MHSLRKVYALFTHILRRCLHQVYARFTQGLRRLCKVYAEFTQFHAVLVHAVSCVNLARDFTGLRRVYAGLRRFTHIVRKPEYVYARFTQVYAAYAGLRGGQLADEAHFVEKVECSNSISGLGYS